MNEIEEETDYSKFPFPHCSKVIYNTDSGKTVQEKISHELYDAYCLIYIWSFLIQNGVKFIDDNCIIIKTVQYETRYKSRELSYL